MKSTILISRITRLVETNGAIGDGAALSEEYNKAIRAANTRLEAVQGAIDAKQTSDAVRLLEDSPRLVDEISVLDFSALDSWAAICGMKRWAAPEKLDKSLVDRILMFCESKDVIEPFLKMYRKSVVTNNNRLAVKSLMWLVDVDSSQDWHPALAKAEQALAEELAQKFAAAKSSGKQNSLDEIAQEFTDIKWSEPPKTRELDAIRKYIADKEAALLDAEVKENIAIIRACDGDKWDCSLAHSIIQALDRLQKKGCVLQPDDKALVAKCRKRCGDEMAAAEKARRRKALCERLHSAIQRDDAAKVREVMSEPEFMDAPPEGDLLDGATDVLCRAEKRIRRKRLLVAAGVVIAVGIAMAFAVQSLRRKLFNDRCDGEAAKLESLCAGAHAVDRLGEALADLKASDPDVCADPRISVFEGRLETLRAQTAVRTNELASITAELSSMRDRKWSDGIDPGARFARIDEIMTADDETYKTTVEELRADWNDYARRTAEAKFNVAAKFKTTLVSHIETVADRLEREWLTPELKKEVESCRASIDEWRRIHGGNAKPLVAEIDAAENRFADAEKRNDRLREAVNKLCGSKTATEIEAARLALLENFPSYPFVDAMRELPVSDTEIASVVSDVSVMQLAFEEQTSAKLDKDAVAAFVEDNIRSLEDIASYYSLYGLYLKKTKKHDYGRDYPDIDVSRYFALSKGRPDVISKSYEKIYRVKGELLDLIKDRTVDEIPAANENVKKPSFRRMELSEEIHELVDACSVKGLTADRLENILLSFAKRHIKAAGEKDFLVQEAGENVADETLLRIENKDYYAQNHLSVGRYPAILRARQAYLYFKWLNEDLKLMPPELASSYSRLEYCAQPVSVEGIPDDLTWACMSETRVRRKNAECARILAGLAQSDLIGKYQQAKQAGGNMRRLVKWKIECAGKIGCDFDDERQLKGAMIPSMNDGVTRDHPIYVLRKEANRLRLKKVLIPYSNGTKWAFYGNVAKDLYQGEPLYQVSEDGIYIDAERVVSNLLGEMPYDLAKKYSRIIPLFDVEVN